jgi:hypothetical protein
VERVRDQALAGAGLAQDHHMARRLGDVEDGLAQLLDSGARAHQAAHHHGRRRRKAPAQGTGLQRAETAPPSALAQLGQPVGLEGLLHEVEGPDPHGLHRHRHVAVPGHQDHGHPGSTD